MMMKIATFAIFTLLFIHVSASIIGVRKRDLHAYTDDKFECFDGSKTISNSLVNDDYCDCRDGSDEPGTNACNNGRFWCKNRGHRGRFIPSSTVNDGICDCCDGSDEYNTNVCTNTCLELGASARQEREETLKAIEGGAKIRQTWVDEAKVFLEEQQKKLNELESQLKIEEETFVEAEQKKNEEEALEKEENDRLKAEYDAKYAKPEEDSVDEPLESNDNNSIDDTKEEIINDDDEKTKENFPYPKEYAAPSDNTNDEGTEENFPYPKEYAAPPQEETIATNNNNDDSDGEHSEENNNNNNNQDGEGEGEGEGDAVPPYEAYKSDAANDARTVYNEAKRVRDETQRKVDEVKKVISRDFGPDNVFTALHDMCFEFKQKQYTYEMCPFNKASQKEHSSTSLGVYDSYDKEKETFVFKNGQTCWQGPARSLTVHLKCGVTNEITSVEEPSKCVYAMVFRTPAVCYHEHADALRLNMEDNGDDDDDE